LIVTSPEVIIGFDVMTMFYPLHFKEYFSDECIELFNRLNEDGFHYGINYSPILNIPAPARSAVANADVN